MVFLVKETAGEIKQRALLFIRSTFPSGVLVSTHNSALLSFAAFWLGGAVGPGLSAEVGLPESVGGKPGGGMLKLGGGIPGGIPGGGIIIDDC